MYIIPFFHNIILFLLYVILEQYIEELKSLINNEGHEVVNEGYYEWKIEDWNSLQIEEFSDEFEINNNKW